LPSAASENIVSISDSNWSAGLIAQRKTSSSSPAFHQVCETPGATPTGLAGAGLQRATGDFRAERAGDDVERLPLARVDMGGRDAAAGIGVELDHDAVAASLRSRLQERHALAGDGIDQGLSFLDHLSLLARR
jgi:hypothetical protein